MKLSWKLFFITMPVFVIFLILSGTWIIQDSFGHSLNQEIDRCMAENQMFQNSYELTRNSLSERQWEQTTVQKVVESFYHGQERQEGNARIYGESGNVLYQDNDLAVAVQEGTAASVLMSSLDAEHNVGYMLGEQDGEQYVVVLGSSSFGDYIETIRNISGIYRNREIMYARYRVGVALFSVLVGGIVLLVIFLVMRNMQKLSRATRQFARGQYEVRVAIRSQDEIGHLAEDFNWMADAMNIQMKRMEQEVHRQEEFTAAFAHELKTPLTSIIGYADTIRQMELSKEETDMCADYIFRQGKRLQSLSYKLLDLTMAGKQDITPQEIYVPDFLQEISRAAAEILKEKRLQLSVEAEYGVIYGDRDLLTSLFLNLVDNARKASEPGMRIRLTGYREVEGYLIAVEDEGRGIAKGELARITEAFYMVDKSRSRKEGGAGIGLALCQKIVELHHASWRFESEVGQGLKVSVMFWNPEKPARRRQRELTGRAKRLRAAGKIAERETGRKRRRTEPDKREDR